MATINYVTLEFPELLTKWTELIQATPHFNVYKNKFQPGVIFRIPHKVKVGELCHVFIEHEVNLSNTLRTGTLTMKVQLTFLPVHIGVFSGFEVLKGTYKTDWWDEDYGEDYFVPNYNSEGNVKKVVPLPINMKTNLYEYLNEILFSQVEDVDLLDKYAVHLGCQKEKLKASVKFIPAPELSSDTLSSANAHRKTEHFFEVITRNDVNLLPTSNSQLQLPL